MKIKKIMTAELATCSADAPVADAAKLMWERDCGIIPVLENDSLVGVVTDRDICMAALMTGLPLGLIRVREVMTTEVVVCNEDDELMAAHGSMRESQIRRMPVVDDEDKLVGVITLNDLANEAFSVRSKAALKRQRDVARTFAVVSEPRPVELDAEDLADEE